MLFADSRKDRLCIKRLVGTELDIEELYVSEKIVLALEKTMH
jgi:hypothetical protein